MSREISVWTGARESELMKAVLGKMGGFHEELLEVVTDPSRTQTMREFAAGGLEVLRNLGREFEAEMRKAEGKGVGVAE